MTYVVLCRGAQIELRINGVIYSKIVFLSAYDNFDRNDMTLI